jgi:hypothetical protein
MTLVSRTLRYVDYSLTGITVLLGVGALYMWYHAIMWWGDPTAMASAMAWTVLTLVVAAVDVGVEKARGLEG